MVKAFVVLLLFAALCFAQAPPVITPSSGFEVPSPGLCVGPPNIGSVYNRLGDPAVAYAGLYTCEQIGPTTAGGGSYGWVGARNAIQLQGRAIATTAPTDTQVLVWDATAGMWKPGAGGGGGVTSVVVAGTSPISVSGTCTITTSGTCTVAAPTVVVGPSSVTDNHVALFNGTTGKLIKDGVVITGLVRVLLVKVWVSVVPTTSPAGGVLVA